MEVEHVFYCVSFIREVPYLCVCTYIHNKDLVLNVSSTGHEDDDCELPPNYRPHCKNAHWS